jgi:hypothetical protein
MNVERATLSSAGAQRSNPNFVDVWQIGNCGWSGAGIELSFAGRQLMSCVSTEGFTPGHCYVF